MKFDVPDEYIVIKFKGVIYLENGVIIALCYNWEMPKRHKKIFVTFFSVW